MWVVLAQKLQEWCKDVARVVSRVLLGGPSQKSQQSSTPEGGNQAISRDQDIRVSLFFCPF